MQSSWTLDGVGNWLSVNGQSQQFSSTNELVQSAAAAGGPATIAYDNDGNETDDGTYLYTYDALNRLTSVTLKSDGELIASTRTTPWVGASRRSSPTTAASTGPPTTTTTGSKTSRSRTGPAP